MGRMPVGIAIRLRCRFDFDIEGGPRLPPRIPQLDSVSVGIETLPEPGIPRPVAVLRFAMPKKKQVERIAKKKGGRPPGGGRTRRISKSSGRSTSG